MEKFFIEYLKYRCSDRIKFLYCFKYVIKLFLFVLVKQIFFFNFGLYLIKFYVFVDFRVLFYVEMVVIVVIFFCYDKQFKIFEVIIDGRQINDEYFFIC